MDLSPQVWNWCAVNKGDTFPAQQVEETLSDTAIASISLVIKLAGAVITTLTDSSGITLTTATAGAWDFTIDEIDTSTYAAGVYSYELQVTDDASQVRTEFEGTWEILAN